MNKTEAVLKHLQEKGSITSIDAIYKYGCTRLSSVIFNLKKRGYIIQTVNIHNHDRNNMPSRYARYVYKGVQE